MFGDFMKELYKDVSFYQPIGIVIPKEKNGNFSFLNKNKCSFPFSKITINNENINLNSYNCSIEKAKEISEYINKNLLEISLKNTNEIIDKLEIYLNSSIILKSRNLLKITEEIYNKSFDNILFKEILKIYDEINNFHDNFYEFFNIIASYSSTPLANFLESLEFLLRHKISINIQNSESFFDIYYEYKESFSNNELYHLIYFENENNIEKEINIKINSIDELIELYNTL